jgi:hypothetical protein
MALNSQTLTVQILMFRCSFCVFLILLLLYTNRFSKKFLRTKLNGKFLFSAFWGIKATHLLIILKLMESQKITKFEIFYWRKKSNWNFFLVRLYCQNNHKWKLPQAADKKLNSQAWNIGMTESYEEIDSSNSLLTVEHHYYLAKGSVTYLHVIYFKTSLSESFCFVFQIPTQYADCRFNIQFCWFRIQKTSQRESKSLFAKKRHFNF